MDYTFTKDQIKELVTYLAKDFIKEDGLSNIATLHTGVVNGDGLAQFVQGSFKNVKIANGCKPTYDTADISNGKVWALGTYGAFVEWCENQLEKELLRAEKLYDLTENEAFMQYATDYLQKSFVESMFARNFFGSAESGDYTTSGLTNASGSNGIAKQAIELVANGDANANQIVSVATNTKTALRNGTTAIDLLFEVVDNMSADLKRQSDKYVMVGENFMSDLAYCARMAKSCWNETQYEELANGYKKTTFDGITIIVNPLIDSIIENMQSGDLFYGKRAVIFASAPEYVHIGTREGENETFKADIWYSQDDKVVRGDIAFNTGALIGSNKDFVLAY